MYKPFVILVVFCIVFPGLNGQTIFDNFEGGGNINSWVGDASDIKVNTPNPFRQGINTSEKVLEYKDNGGQYANARFDIDGTFRLSEDHLFSCKIYVPSSGLTGNQTNQMSLKLQNGNLAEPWTTQSEIIKPIALDQWQTVTFDFKNDTYFSFDPNSVPPSMRQDFSRVLVQINGENNGDRVVAYIDDMTYDGKLITAPVYDRLVWSDEFDQNGAIDNTKWFHQTQLPAGGGWFNGELQHYTNRTANSYVQNGNLNIVAKRESFTDQGFTKNFTSARLNSKFAFTYGRVEVRAKLPSGLGTWPAIWMLGKNITEVGAYWYKEGFGTTGWPACGEIDIMEHWAYNQNFVQSALHTTSSFGNTFNKGGQNISTVSTDFHVYTLDWSPDRMVFSVDDKVHYIYNPPVKDNDTWPFDKEQYLLLNIAIDPSVTAGFLQSSMEIDYVRVYQEGLSKTNDEIADNTIFYPNPVQETITFVVDETVDKSVKIKLFTVEGQLIQVYDQKIDNNQITINGLETLNKGLYVIWYQQGNKINSFTFVKS